MTDASVFDSDVLFVTGTSCFILRLILTRGARKLVSISLSLSLSSFPLCFFIMVALCLRILEEEGYRKLKDTVSAATSAIALPDKPQTPPPPLSPQPQV